MREQLLAAAVATLDAVIWTHDHADHCHGIDDLRQVYHAMRRPVLGYARAPTLAVLRERFAYAFDGLDGYPPTVDAAVLPDRLSIGGIDVSVVDQPHGSIHTTGLRFEADGLAIGYATDFNVMTDDMAVLYRKLDVWIVDALRRAPHPTHPNLATALHWIEAFAPRQAALVHMDHTMDYATLVAELPVGVEPGYDNLILPW